jgi:hypothetical protein
MGKRDRCQYTRDTKIGRQPTSLLRPSKQQTRLATRVPEVSDKRSPSASFVALSKHAVRTPLRCKRSEDLLVHLAKPQILAL